MFIGRYMKKLLIIIMLFLFISTVHASENEHVLPTYEDSYYEALYENAVEAIKQEDIQKADFYLARYIGASFFDTETDKDISDLFPLFGSYKVSKPTSFISGKYSDDFLQWFITGSNSMWGRDDNDDLCDETHSFGIISNANDEYIVSVIASPYLEGWSVIGNDNFGTAVLTLIDAQQKPYICLLSHEESMPKKVFDNTYLDTEQNIQFIWRPEFHDLDGDGKDELWVRYNKAWGSGFSQELAIYKITDNGLELFKKFEGVPEGIARRLEGNIIETGYGFPSDPGIIGHLGYDMYKIERWKYQDGDFVKISEEEIPHILWSDAWVEYYFGSRKA